MDRDAEMGRAFRAKVSQQYVLRQKEDPARSHDLTALCRAENFVGRTVADLGVVVGAAGGKVIDVRTLSDSVQKANDADYIANFPVFQSPFGGSNFIMLVRVKQLQEKVVVDSVTSCGVTSIYL